MLTPEQRRMVETLRSEDLAAAVEHWWDIESHIVPWPKRELTCPMTYRRDDGSMGQCGGTLQVRHWRFHQFHTSWEHKVHRYRCDISFKCRRCSTLHVFGVPVPREMFDYHGLHLTITAKQMREADGNIESMAEQDWNDPQWARFRKQLFGYENPEDRPLD